MMLAPSNAMPHHHLWHSEPPEGKFTWSKSWDERYGDEEDMAANAMLTSPEETIRLRMELKKDPDYVASSNWPSLVEWCSTCTSTRLVRLVLPEEEHEVKEAVVKEEVKQVAKVVEVEKASCCEARAVDAFTQTPPRRRRGGRGSSMRRLLAFQLMLSKKKGLPLSRLLTITETNSRHSKREEQMRLQEESASPLLNRKSAKVGKEEEKVLGKEGVKEEESGLGKEVSSSGSTYFTLRNFPTVADPPSTQPLPRGPCLPPSPAVSPPLSTPPFFTPPWIPLHPTPQFGQMPAANWVICGGCQMWGTVVPFWAAHSV